MLPITNILNFNQSTALCITSFIGSIRLAAGSWRSGFGIGRRSDRLQPVKVAAKMYPMVILNPETNHELKPGGAHSV